MTADNFVKKFKKLTFFLCLMCYAIGLVTFVFGFMPGNRNKMKSLSTNNFFKTCKDATEDSQLCEKIKNNISNSKYYERIVVIVIDALRADFIPSVSLNSEFNTTLRFTEALIKNKTAISFIKKVHSPTVTMPRIRTLATGDISNFMDALANLDASELNEDSILHQAHLSELKSIFYGDETWLKLFPNLFIRSEGTHSFFVTDYQEVDTNVTRHLKSELSKKDWDIMILHYLGVDHIGHAYGPYSDLLPIKLEEMDEVIKYVYYELKRESKMQSLIVICGDHGMTAAGSHGGISKSELLTPLVFINTNPSEFHSKGGSEMVDQVDFVPTLSTLLAIQIPVNSFGNIIPSVLHFSGLPPEHILNAAFHNLLQLFQVYKSVFPAKSQNYIDSIRRVMQNHSELFNSMKNIYDFSDNNYTILLNLYMSLLSEMKHDLLASVSGYKLIYIIVGLIVVWLSFFCAVISFLITEQDYKLYKILHDFFKRTIYNKLIMAIFIVTLLALIVFKKSLLILGLLPITHFVILVIYLGFWILKFLIRNLRLTSMEKSCLLFFIIHAISLFSSSYIEEEHQTWYFTVSTMLTLYLGKCLIPFSNFYSKVNNKKSSSQLQQWNIVSLYKNFENIILLFFLLTFHRILRNWNRTGDKWQHLPDIFDWLNKEENAPYSHIMVASSLLSIVFYLSKKQCTFIYYAHCLGVFFIYLYKFHKEYITQIFEKIHLDVILIPWFIYILATLIILSTVLVKGDKMWTINFITGWILLTNLIGRTNNIPLTAAILLQEYSLHRIVWKNSNVLLNASWYLQMAMCSFFYQGNSNSLSTIDIFSGYVGLMSYKPVIVGFLIACNTYSNVVLWLVLMIYRMLSALGSSALPKIFFSFLVFIIYKLFVLALYCIIMYLMKHHLFILSVFAPKLFYEVCHTVLFIVFTFIILLTIIWNDKLLR